MKRILFASARDPFSEVETRYPPLWPACLAAMLEKHLGSEAFDFHLLRGKFEDELASFNPDVVAISSVTQNFTIAKEYARAAKARGKPVIIGGPHITALPECLSAEMDVACIGEGEETFLELMRLYLDTPACAAPGTTDRGASRPNGLEQIRGIAYHDNGKLTRTPPRPQRPSLDDLPHPKRSLLGYGRRTYMVTSRGCPYRCVFCGSSRHWGKVRYASPEYVLDEIGELVEHGVRVIRFNDDTFTANKDRLKQIAGMIAAKGFHRQVKFSCWCRANTITPEVVDALKAMNMVAVVMGLESGSDRVLRYLKGPNVTVADNSRAINLLKDAGIQTSADFIIGSPDETEEEIMATYNFIKKSRLDFVTINVFSPLPGTPVWDTVAQKNLVSPDMDWRRLDFKFNSDEGSAIVLSEKLSYEQLRRLHRKFERLVFFKTLKALPRSPWIGELPKLVWRRLIGKAVRLARLR